MNDCHLDVSPVIVLILILTHSLTTHTFIHSLWLNDSLKHLGPKRLGTKPSGRAEWFGPKRPVIPHSARFGTFGYASDCLPWRIDRGRVKK